MSQASSSAAVAAAAPPLGSRRSKCARPPVIMVLVLIAIVGRLHALPTAVPPDEAPALLYERTLHELCPGAKQPHVPTAAAAPQHIELINCTAAARLKDNQFGAFGAAVTSVRIADSAVTQIAPAALNGLRQLHTLQLTGNAFDRLDRWATHYFNALERLDLSANGIRTAADAALRSYPNVLALRLDGNRLAALADGFFAATVRLQSIDLTGNQLSELNGRLLAGLGALQVLSLAGNRLTVIAPDAFAGCGALRTLRLEGNALQRLDGRLLAPLGGLQWLDVSENAVQALETGVFVRCGELRWLDLSGNRLGALQADWTDGLRRLESLNLSRNAITHLHPLAQLDQLQQLNISDNRLVEIAGDTFAPLRQLQSIDLAANRLERIDTATFANNRLLRSVDVAHNRLDTENFLQPVASLRHLSMAYNRFHTMNLTTFFHFHNVNLAGNPWSCTWLIEEMMVAADGIHFGKNYTVDGGAHPMTVPGIDCTDEAGQLRSIVVLQVPEKRRNSYGSERLMDGPPNDVVASETIAAVQQNKTIRKLLDDEFDYKACLIWTAVAVIAVFSMVHLGKVFFARSEQNSEKYRLSQQVGLLTNSIETTLTRPPKFAPFQSSSSSPPQTPGSPMTPLTAMTPMTPMSPPLTPPTPSLLVHQQPQAKVMRSSSSSDKRNQRPNNNVYFARHDYNDANK